MFYYQINNIPAEDVEILDGELRILAEKLLDIQLFNQEVYDFPSFFDWVNKDLFFVEEEKEPLTMDIIERLYQKYLDMYSETYNVTIDYSKYPMYSTYKDIMAENNTAEAVGE